MHNGHVRKKSSLAVVSTLRSVALSELPSGRSAMIVRSAWLIALLASARSSPESDWASALKFIEELAPQRRQQPSDRAADPPPVIPYFLRSFSAESPQHIALDPDVAHRLDGVVNLRLLPAAFPTGMGYHFDGLATILSLSVANGSLTFFTKAFGSNAARDYSSCLFMGTGTSKFGTTPCFQNPVVNLLPIAGQLWLTIDTASWGRVDARTLETLPSQARVPSIVLNAHPACDPATGDCYVQHPCSSKAGGLMPISKDVCFSRLVPSTPWTSMGDLQTEDLAHSTIPHSKLIQHSHSPCLTPNYLVSKLDAFTPRLGSAFKLPFPHGGILGMVHQMEDNVWLVMERATNVSRVLFSNASFVNNHFWNCYEDASSGEIVVESVPATAHYLDIYFQANLANKSFDWGAALEQPLRCRIPAADARADGAAAADTPFGCAPLLPASPDLLFDYPTYNPQFKMRPDYRWMYAISPASRASRWFDQLVKVDVRKGGLSKSWSAPGMYLTEFDFHPTSEGVAADDEDDGLLLSVLYNATADSSSFGVFDAKTLAPIGIYPLGAAVPFHAHGIVCRPQQGGPPKCFSNP